MDSCIPSLTCRRLGVARRVNSYVISHYNEIDYKYQILLNDADISRSFPFPHPSAAVEPGIPPEIHTPSRCLSSMPSRTPTSKQWGIDHPSRTWQPSVNSSVITLICRDLKFMYPTTIPLSATPTSYRTHQLPPTLTDTTSRITLFSPMWKGGCHYQLSRIIYQFPWCRGHGQPMCNQTVTHLLLYPHRRPPTKYGSWTVELVVLS